MAAAAQDTPRPGTPARQRVRADVVVAGGGLAGLAAALSAARGGADTVLVHDRPVLGGNSSSEVRVAPAGAAHFAAWARETGIVEELLLRDRAGNHEHFYENGLTNSHYDLTLLDAAYRQRGLRLFLNTTVTDVGVREDAAAGHRVLDWVAGHQGGTGRRYRFDAASFADCTGDGTVGFLAGADHRYGRESRAEHGEPLAPLVADRSTSGSTLCLRARDIGTPVRYHAPDWARRYEHLDELGDSRRLRSLGNPEFGGFWWLEIGDPYHQVDDTEDIAFELRRHVLGLWDFLKNRHPQRDALRCHALEWVGALPGKRESRRLLGDVVLTEHDCHRDRRWPDRVGTAGWYIDLHIQGGIRNTAEPAEPSFVDAHYRHWVRVAPFSVPLRALYSRNVANLWLGGRCLSATHVALGPLRVQGTLGMLGQAMGAAAAHAVARRCTPRELAADQPAVERLRQALLADGVRILGTREDDPDDLARTAVVSASSQAPLDFGGPGDERHRLDTRLGQVLPVSGDHLARTEVHLVNPSERDARVDASLSVLERIWDQDDGHEIAATSVTVAPGFSGWVPIRWDRPVPPRRPLRLVLADPTGRVSWSQARHQPTGTCAHYEYVSGGGCEPANRALATFAHQRMALPAHRRWYHHRDRSLAVRVTPQQYPFGPDNAVNGRAWPEDLPNLWISAPDRPLPQHLDLDLRRERVIGAVSIDFDTDLRVPLGRAPGRWRAETCARDYRLLVRSDGQPWRPVAEVTGNHERRRSHRVGPLAARHLRLEVLADNGGHRRWWRDTTAERRFLDTAAPAPSARVYAIRVHPHHPAPGGGDAAAAGEPDHAGKGDG